MIAGPTASGKSALALALAQRTPATIINMDASQVYADLPILSAQPSATERAICPHALYGFIDGAALCSAAHWAVHARAAVAEAQAAGRLPIVVGGTGLYMRTLLDGIAPVPDIDPDVRAAVRGLAVSDAYAALCAEDPVAAQRLAPADTTRVARALEVVRSTGAPLHVWQAQRVGGIGADVRLRACLLLPPRDWLMARCDARLDAMIAQGALDEVATLMARRLPPSLPVMRAIGVPEFSAALGGEMRLPDARAAAQLATRQYAKRQYTWFRNQCPATWSRHTMILNHDIASDLALKLCNTALT